MRAYGLACNGLSYKMRFTPEAKRGDILVHSAGAQVLVDSKSALYIKGTHLDYSTEMNWRRLQVYEPQRQRQLLLWREF